MAINVYQGEGEEVQKFGEEFAGNGLLKLSYHKFLYTSAHYNSLVPVA